MVNNGAIETALKDLKLPKKKNKLCDYCQKFQCQLKHVYVIF